MTNENTSESADTLGVAEWKALYRAGALAAWAMLGLMPVQAGAFLLAPPPETVEGFFALFQRNPLLGLVSLDLVYMLEILLAGLVLLALCVALRCASPPLVTLAMFFNLTAVSIYFPSNTAFEMLNLSSRYAAANTDAQRQPLLAAGEAMLALYQGTAFNVSYVLAALAGLLVALAMSRSTQFSKTTVRLGIVMNILGLVPPTIGMIGMAAALLFLLPLLVWLVLIARKLAELARP